MVRVRVRVRVRVSGSDVSVYGDKGVSDVCQMCVNCVSDLCQICVCVWGQRSLPTTSHSIFYSRVGQTAIVRFRLVLVLGLRNCAIMGTSSVRMISEGFGTWMA